MKRLHAIMAFGAALAVAGGAGATDLVLRAGVHDVVPKSDNNPTVNVGSNATLSLGGSWYLTDKVALDLLGAIPFKHDVNLNGGGKVATVKHLPPTLGVQYHFNRGGGFDPYVGVGVNYTLFFDKQTTGALAGTKLTLENSFGPAVQLGGDIQLGNDWLLGIDIRYANIKGHAKVLNASGGLVLDVGDVKVDPMIYGITIGKRFSL